LHAVAVAVCATLGVSFANAAPDLSGGSDASIKQVLQVVAAHQMGEVADGDYTPVSSMEALDAARKPRGIRWDYPWGVTLYGMLRAGDFLDGSAAREFVYNHNLATGRYYTFLAAAGKKIDTDGDAWKTFLRNRNRSAIGGLMRLGNLDNCGAMGTEILEAINRWPERTSGDLRAVAARVADWIINKQERLPDGTFWRPEATDGRREWQPGTLWIDDLYMACPFLTRWAHYTGDHSHVDDAARQVINMAARMQDGDGVWFHGYSEHAKKASPFKWGRANGWAMIAAIEVLSVMPGNHPLREKLLGILRRHIEGIKPLQAASGMWRQVLDEKDIWEETSCSAMFAYGIARAVNRGWISPDNMTVARKAFAGVCTQITPDGKVNGTCVGTGISLTLDFYAGRPRPDDEMHGRGAVLLAGAEILDAPRAAASRAAASRDMSGRTDASVRAVLEVVSKHQIRPLADGDFAPVSTLAAFKAARLPDGVAWDYPWGVTLYGMLRASDVIGDKSARDFVISHNQTVGRYYAFLAAAQPRLGMTEDAWRDQVRTIEHARIFRLMLLGNLDNCGAMGAELLEGMLRYPDTVTPGQKMVAERVADWIVNKQERLDDGTFWRPMATNNGREWQPGTLWIDDLYMSCPFLVRWAKYTNEPGHIADAARQIINMAARMQDKDGIWFHAYSEHAKKASPLKWGRANGWAMVAAVEVLSAMPADHPLRGKLLDILRRHIEGIKPHQAASGMWRQVLDEKDIWEETSCSAMFAYCIARAVNRGWISPDNMAIARKAFAGVCTQITPDGKVNGTCRGTGIGLTLAFYAARTRPDNDMHGRGLVLLAGAELLAENPAR
jgi:rhamnogalacturonyl hydrolase YesR